MSTVPTLQASTLIFCVNSRIIELPCIFLPPALIDKVYEIFKYKTLTEKNYSTNFQLLRLQYFKMTTETLVNQNHDLWSIFSYVLTAQHASSDVYPPPAPHHSFLEFYQETKLVKAILGTVKVWIKEVEKKEKEENQILDKIFEKNGLVLFQLNLTLRFNNVDDEVHKCKTKIQVLRKEMVRDRVYCDDSYYELTRMQFMDYNVNSF